MTAEAEELLSLFPHDFMAQWATALSTTRAIMSGDSGPPRGETKTNGV